MNPEWNELVTDKGIVKNKKTFTQQVNDLMNDLLNKNTSTHENNIS